MAKDLFHNNVKVALQKDGWKITHDPYQLRYGIADVYIDLAAEEAIAAYEVRLIIYSPNQEVIDRWIE
jgi:XisH protein